MTCAKGALAPLCQGHGPDQGISPGKGLGAEGRRRGGHLAPQQHNKNSLQNPQSHVSCIQELCTLQGVSPSKTQQFCCQQQPCSRGLLTAQEEFPCFDALKSAQQMTPSLQQWQLQIQIPTQRLGSPAVKVSQGGEGFPSCEFPV